MEAFWGQGEKVESELARRREALWRGSERVESKIFKHVFAKYSPRGLRRRTNSCRMDFVLIWGSCWERLGHNFPHFWDAVVKLSF